MIYFPNLKKSKNPYECFNLKGNPFSIAPLFRNFKDANECELEENLFILPPKLEMDLEILLDTEDQRILIYGFYGIGKTSFADFFFIPSP